MIVPMKKVAVITQAKDADSALAKLAALGIVHVEHQQLPKGKSVDALIDEVALLNQAVGILSVAEFKNKERREKEPGDWKFIARHIIDSRNRLNQLEEYSRNMRGLISDWEPWGNFDPEEINLLAKKGIYLRLLSIPARELKDLPSGLIVEKLFSSAGMIYCAVVSREKTELPFKEISLPKMPLEKMRARLAQDTKACAQIKDELSGLTSYLPALLRAKDLLQKELQFQEALAGMGQAGNLSFLTGYIPLDLSEKLTRAAQKEKWGITLEDPSPEDNVPTFIRTPRLVSIISPVFKLMGIVPGYRELDISPFFLVFLGLFFGMIIGDAGYGAVYFALTFFAQRKLGRKIAEQKIFFLFYFFSACAIFWGVLTGTFFGQEWYLEAGLKPLIPVLQDTKFLQAFCFFLGAFHLTLGHLMRAAHKVPSLTALTDLGWIGILWAAFFLARTLILNEAFPSFAHWLILAGASLVILFTSPQRNILKMFGKGLGALALSLVNNFTDVVSYVRLFAVGLAGIAISDTVNTLAHGLGGANPIAKILILFIGHSVNMMLGPLSVMVHGVRLNVLEFSGHAGLAWSGIAYKPLKE